jgi:hypothetical protein
MSVKEIVAFLCTWQPSGDRLEPSPEGLERVLAGTIASAPERFATEACRFQDLDPTYIRALLSGLQQAVKHQQGFPWAPVIALCQWVIQQPRESLVQESTFLFRDAGWNWSRTTIIELLSDGFTTDQAAIPLDLRRAVWEILQPLTDDLDPTPEHEARYDDAHAAPVTLSVNTPRGKALDAVVDYAHWVQRQSVRGEDDEESTPRSFADMPEVREVLDWHLDPAHDPSLSTRALYGMRLPWLFYLDRAWVTARIPRIFPTEETLRTLREVAWESYVTSCPPYDDVFEVLREEYRSAVDRIGARNPHWHRLANPEESLAMHLMSLYQRGRIALDDPESLLARFYAKATDPLCGYALEVVGRGLGEWPAEIPTEILERLQALWTQRLAVARASTSPTSHAIELAAFGWWFASTKFDDVWAMTQLTETLTLVGKVQLDQLVIQYLATLAPSMSFQTVECVRLLCEGDKEGWRIQTWHEPINQWC